MVLGEDRRIAGLSPAVAVFHHGNPAATSRNKKPHREARAEGPAARVVGVANASHVPEAVLAHVL